MELSPRAPRRRAKRRLSRSADFERVYRQGRSFGGRFFILHLFPRSDEGELAGEGPRLGLSVSRKCGGAVERNRIKRLLREAFEGQYARLHAADDIVIVARPDAGELAEREGLEGVERELSELVDQAAAEEAA